MSRQNRLWAVHCGIVVLLGASTLHAQTGLHERVFAQSTATIQKMLDSMQLNLAGRLPVLDGFAGPGEHPLDRYERGYYQAKVQVSPTAAGGSRVRVSVKVTAWYSDASGSRSGYELLPSNGRLEDDILDQLSEQIAHAGTNEVNRVASASTPETPASPSLAGRVVPSATTAATDASAGVNRADSATTPAASSEPSAGESGISAPSAVSRDASNKFSTSSPNLSTEERASERSLPDAGQPNSASPNLEKANSALQAEAESLEEVLRNQAHPRNLVAVKKSGTAVVDTPSLNAKPLFLASRHDEFEMLDFNRDWVHVRISGLSRGWIWRNGVEMPEGISDTDAQAGPAPAADLFHVVSEETATFPGDWAPLAGKTVKIISVQKTDDNAKGSGPSERLAYVKFLLDKNYAELTKKTPTQTQELTGIVVIFDSADGGMIAATTAALQQWKAGTLSDSALWHRCFFDPPEMFDSAGPTGSQ